MFVCMLSASIGRTRTHGWAHSLTHARRETVGNTAPFAGQTDATDTPGHSGVPGSRMPVQPPEVRTDTWTRSAHDAHAYMRAWTRTAHAQVTQRRRLQAAGLFRHARGRGAAFLQAHVCACAMLAWPPLGWRSLSCFTLSLSRPFALALYPSTSTHPAFRPDLHCQLSRRRSPSPLRSRSCSRPRDETCIVETGWHGRHGCRRERRGWQQRQRCGRVRRCPRRRRVHWQRCARS